MESNRDRLTIAGFALFIGGSLFTGRYMMRALAMPHTYTDVLLIGGGVTLIGAVLAVVGVLGYSRRR
ncbi:hypothetical protein [Catenulispora subtropica]|uniref:Uncharacterized protein n=1 Tax=Catenulispora subtropica TaxID=450798 RepID=A0ABP5BYL9_9ACTN